MADAERSMETCRSIFKPLGVVAGLLVLVSGGVKGVVAR